jgi:hypothetical protein
MNGFPGTENLLHGGENLEMLAAAFAMQENSVDCALLAEFRLTG